MLLQQNHLAIASMDSVVEQWWPITRLGVCVVLNCVLLNGGVVGENILFLGRVYWGKCGTCWGLVRIIRGVVYCT